VFVQGEISSKADTCLNENMSAVDSLEENPKEVLETALRLLLTVADNILNNPRDIKFRRLKLANKNVSEKLLPAIGAIECLFEMGFDEVRKNI